MYIYIYIYSHDAAVHINMVACCRLRGSSWRNPLRASARRARVVVVVVVIVVLPLTLPLPLPVPLPLPLVGCTPQAPREQLAQPATGGGAE